MSLSLNVSLSLFLSMSLSLNISLSLFLSMSLSLNVSSSQCLFLSMSLSLNVSFSQCLYLSLSVCLVLPFRKVLTRLATIECFLTIKTIFIRTSFSTSSISNVLRRVLQKYGNVLVGRRMLLWLSTFTEAGKGKQSFFMIIAQLRRYRTELSWTW